VALQWPGAGRGKAARQSLELEQSGTRTMTPRRTITYTLVATGDDGKPVTLSASVSVRPAGSPGGVGDRADDEPIPTPQRRSDSNPPGHRIGDPGATRTTAGQSPVQDSTSQPAASPATGRAQIMPVDEQGTPVLAWVEIYRGDRRILGEFTGSGGVGFSGNIGDYRVRVTADGYEPGVVTFKVETDGWKRVPITLRKK
jgi:hypothetical protein